MLKRLSLLDPISLGVAILLAFIPLYLKFPLVNVKGTYVAIRLEDLLVAVVVFVWFIHQLKTKFSVFNDRLSWLFILYWGVGGASLISALLLTKNVVPQIAVLHFLRRIEYMSLFFVALTSITSFKKIKLYQFSLLLTVLGVIIYGVGQKYLYWPVVSTMNREFSKGTLLRLNEGARVSSTFAGHYDLAAYLVLITSFLLALFFAYKNQITKKIIFLLYLGCLYLLVLTASRISFAAYLFSITFLLVWIKKHWWIPPILAVSIICMLLSTQFSQRYAATLRISLTAFSGSLPRANVSPQITPTSTPTPTPTPPVATSSATIGDEDLGIQYSNQIRFNVEWPRALRALAKNPFLGTGYSSVTLATDNDYLRALAETGILGLLSFSLIFIEILRRIAINFRDTKISTDRKLIVAGIAAGALGFFINAAFIDVFEASKVAFIFWILMGILVGILNLSKQKQYE